MSNTAAELSARHPHHGLHAALDELRTRLAEVHDRCHQVDDEAWAAYSTELDRGLDELQLEVARTAEHPDSGPSVDDVLFARTTRLELDGWLLRLEVPGAAPDHARARELASVASRELADYSPKTSTGSGATRAGLGQVMEELRRAAR